MWRQPKAVWAVAFASAVVLTATRGHLVGVDEPETAVEEMRDEVVGSLT